MSEYELRILSVMLNVRKEEVADPAFTWPMSEKKLEAALLVSWKHPSPDHGHVKVLADQQTRQRSASQIVEHDLENRHANNCRFVRLIEERAHQVIVVDHRFSCAVNGLDVSDADALCSSSLRRRQTDGSLLMSTSTRYRSIGASRGMNSWWQYERNYAGKA